jgi:hypothetical protein
MYRLLLHLYPSAWRAEYGAEMAAVFSRKRTAARGIFALLWLWLEAIADVLYNAAAVHLDLLRQDLRYTLRGFLRSPGFAVTAIGIAAVGIGATTAAFTMVDYSLIRPLPFPHQERIVRLYQQARLGAGHFELSPGIYREWKRRSTSFEAMGAYTTITVNLTGRGEPQTLDGARTTSDVFPMLGVQPLIGRLFTPQEDTDAGPAAVLLSSSRAIRE